MFLKRSKRQAQSLHGGNPSPASPAPGAKPTLLPITHEVGATHSVPYKLIPALGPLHSPGLSRTPSAPNVHKARPAFHSQLNSHITSSKRPFLSTQSVSPILSPVPSLSLPRFVPPPPPRCLQISKITLVITITITITPHLNISSKSRVLSVWFSSTISKAVPPTTHSGCRRVFVERKEGKEKESCSLAEKSKTIQLSLWSGEGQAWGDERSACLATRLPHVQEGQWEAIQRGECRRPWIRALVGA